MPPDMHWRNREKGNDKEHHEKASFFYLTDFMFWNVLFVYFLFHKMSLSLSMLLVMLFALEGKRSNSHSLVFFKIGVP